MKYISVIAFLVSSQLVFAENSQIEFFNQISKLCGKTFIGKTVYPDNPDDQFAGKKLVMHIKSCSKNEIRIPFKVGEDTSRTWIISHTSNGLLLKHDHRYENGKPHKLTMYGGYANDQGSSYQQFFPADQQTHQLVPKGKTNVWSLKIDLEKQLFIYDLKRHNKPRYRAHFIIQ